MFSFQFQLCYIMCLNSDKIFKTCWHVLIEKQFPKSNLFSTNWRLSCFPVYWNVCFEIKCTLKPSLKVVVTHLWELVCVTEGSCVVLFVAKRLPCFLTIKPKYTYLHISDNYKSNPMTDSSSRVLPTILSRQRMFCGMRHWAFSEPPNQK